MLKFFTYIAFHGSARATGPRTTKAYHLSSFPTGLCNDALPPVLVTKNGQNRKVVCSKESALLRVRSFSGQDRGVGLGCEAKIEGVGGTRPV